MSGSDETDLCTRLRARDMPIHEATCTRQTYTHAHIQNTRKTKRDKSKHMAINSPTALPKHSVTNISYTEYSLITHLLLLPLYIGHALLSLTSYGKLYQAVETE